MLGPHDVGFRVVVRHIVGVRDGRPVFTDVLGELLAFGAGELIVDGKGGPVSVPMKAVVAGKRIPPKREPTGGPPSVA
jgi:N-acetylglutamate synthase